MIEIHPLKDKDKLAVLYKNAGVIMNADSIAIVATDGDEVLGNCLFDMGNDSITVHHIEPKDDIMFADGLLRSALHVGVQNGKMTAFHSESAPVELISKLGFIKNDIKNELNVEKLFSSCKNC